MDIFRSLSIKSFRQRETPVNEIGFVLQKSLIITLVSVLLTKDNEEFIMRSHAFHPDQAGITRPFVHWVTL
jgi:hypothetical protein